MNGIERFDQREIEHRKIEGLLVADGAVVVPGVVRGEHHVARPEDDVLAIDAGEISRALEAEANRARRMLVRRHDLVGIVEPIGRVHRAHGRALGREARIDENERTPLRVVHRDQFNRLVQNWFDVLRAPPQEWHGARGRHQLLDLVIGDVRRRGPERKHVLRSDVAIERLQRGIPIGKTMDVAFCGHGSCPSWGSLTQAEKNVSRLVRASIN